jgi:hypothetical protein
MKLRSGWTILAATLVLALGFVGCDEEPVGPSASKGPEVVQPVINAPPAKPTDIESLLNSLIGNGFKTWQLIKRSEDEKDVTQDCYLDDQIKIFRKNTIELKTGVSLCRIDGAPVKDRIGYWQMTDRLNLFLRVTGEEPYEMKINLLQGNQMDIAYISNNGKRVIESYLAIDTGENASPTPAPLGSNIGSPPVISKP